MRVWSKLRGENLDTLLISTPENIRYFTKFSGSEAILLLTKGKNFLIVDSRYNSQARKECSEFTIIESKDGIYGASKLFKKMGIKRVGFELKQLTVAQYRELEKAGGIELIGLPKRFEMLRSIKDSRELKLLKKSATISSKVFLNVVNHIKIGAKERDVALLLEFHIKKNGAESTPFPFIVASGKRGALPHGVASDKRIKKGEFVTIDFGAIYQGYCSDETCTLIMGKPTQRQKRVYQVVKDAHDKAMEKVKPGIKAHEIDSTARGLIKKAGLDRYFRHGTGHGVGLAVHEEPRIAPKQDVITETGMVFTIEPGVYIPGWGGVRIEDMVRVTRQGCEPMSIVPKELYCI